MAIEGRVIVAPLQTDGPVPLQRLRAFRLALCIHTLMHQGHFSFKHGGGSFYDATLERKTDREDKGGGGKECGRMKM